MKFIQGRLMRGGLGIATGLLSGFVVTMPIAAAAYDLLPILSFVAPAQNQIVTGAATFYVRSDSAGVVGLQFQIDGQNFGSEITSGSCRATWDSSQKADGLHTIQAIGRDQYGNLTLAPPVTVLVSNPVFVPLPTSPTPTPSPAPGPAPIVIVTAPLAGAVLSGSTTSITTTFPTGSLFLTYSLRDVATGVTRWTATGPNLTSTATSASFTANLSAVPAGAYQLLVLCQQLGRSALTAEVPVTVAPAISMTLATTGGRTFSLTAVVKLKGVAAPGVRVTLVVKGPTPGTQWNYSATTNAQGMAYVLGTLPLTAERGTYQVTSSASTAGLTTTASGSFVY